MQKSHFEENALSAHSTFSPAKRRKFLKFYFRLKLTKYARRHYAPARLPRRAPRREVRRAEYYEYKNAGSRSVTAVAGSSPAADTKEKTRGATCCLAERGGFPPKRTPRREARRAEYYKS